MLFRWWMDQVFGNPIFPRACYFDILSSKPNLVFNLEAWIFFMMFVNIVLVLPLHFVKIKNKLFSKVHQPQGLIFGCKIHDLVHTTIKMELCELESENFVMKSMKIENQSDVGITNVKGPIWVMTRIFCLNGNITLPNKPFTYFHCCGHQ